MRIVAGKWRGHNIFVPDIDDTRPTMDRTRQAVFNILRSASFALHEDGTPILQDAFVLDVFAGSGAMGFEALSQGAASAVFFEQHPEAARTIEKSREKLRAGEMMKLIRNDVMKIGKNHEKPAQIAFFDPPYHKALLEPTLLTMKEKNWLDQDTLLVMELHKREDLNIDLELHDSRIYGTSKIVFAQFKT
jgi:16S rRNA (guanine966-N2)-methyltransferase